jgi:hypothetical protein
VGKLPLVNAAGGWHDYLMNIVTILAMLPFALPAIAETPAVSVTRTADGLIADYRFAHDVTSMDWPEGEDIETLNAHNPGNWTLLTPAMSLKNGVIAKDRGAPFRAFSIRLVPSVDTNIDRIYPALIRLGPKAYLLYAPYLGTGAGYQYVGPKLKGDTSVIAPGVPAALRDEVKQDLKAALDLSTRVSGRRCPLSRPSSFPGSPTATAFCMATPPPAG